MQNINIHDSKKVMFHEKNEMIEFKRVIYARTHARTRVEKKKWKWWERRVEGEG